MYGRQSLFSPTVLSPLAKFVGKFANKINIFDLQVRQLARFVRKFANKINIFHLLVRQLAKFVVKFANTIG